MMADMYQKANRLTGGNVLSVQNSFSLVKIGFMSEDD
jgi:hypothetical protein